MHADGKSTLASVSKWNSVKVNCAIFLLLLDHINSDIFFIVVLSHGKLDLSFFLMAGPKSV